MTYTLMHAQWIVTLPVTVAFGTAEMRWDLGERPTARFLSAIDAKVPAVGSAQR